MRLREVLIYAATALAAVTLIFAGIEVARHFRPGGDPARLIFPILVVATACVCIGVLDWARNLRRQASSGRLRPTDEDAADAPPAAAGAVVEAHDELMTAVHALERIADEERSTERAISEGLRTIAGFANAQSVTYWAVVAATAGGETGPGEDSAGGGPAPEPAAAGEPPGLQVRAHHESGETRFDEAIGDQDDDHDVLRDAVDHAKPFQRIEESCATFLFPLVVERRCLGALRVIVPVGGPPAARSQVAQQLGPDLGQLARLFAQVIYAPDLYDRAVIDSLTGLFTKRHFINRLNEATGSSRRYGEPLSLVLMDVDNFKLLNTTYGHATGDRVLHAAGSLVLENIREADTAYRYGSDEIAIILPGSDVDRACKAAERLSRSLRASRALADDGRNIIFTVSAGVAEFDEDMRGIGPLMARAEQALYAAKAAGRNRVERWREQAGAEDYDEVE